MGLKSGKIVPFDDDFYEKLNHTYINGLPVKIHIKYLKPIIEPGKCYDRSLYMFLALDNVELVRADNKDLELKYGKEKAGHGFVEDDKYVYDPTLLMRFDKHLYYEMYKCDNIMKCNINEYCMSKDNRDLYKKIKETTIDSFKYDFNYRKDLIMFIPVLQGIAQNSQDEEFIKDLNDYLTLISYNEEEISKEVDKEFKKILERR